MIWATSCTVSLAYSRVCRSLIKTLKITVCSLNEDTINEQIISLLYFLLFSCTPRPKKWVIRSSRFCCGDHVYGELMIIKIIRTESNRIVCNASALDGEFVHWDTHTAANRSRQVALPASQLAVGARAPARGSRHTPLDLRRHPAAWPTTPPHQLIAPARRPGRMIHDA